MKPAFAHDLRALYERAGMKPTNGTTFRPALILTERAVRSEVAQGNLEVLIILAFAVNPSRFATHVEVFQVRERPPVYRYRIRDSGNVYEMTAKDVLELAIGLRLKMCRQSEFIA